MTAVLVPRDRVERWILNFQGRHGRTGLRVVGGALTGAAADGSTFSARLPLGQGYAGPPDPATFALAVQPLPDWGVLLVRRGGYAVARLARDQPVGSKVGQRHVQGRTAAGGQSQQRFARRRNNQARQAFQAAADHAARVLGDAVASGAPRLPVVVGGDRGAVDEVLADARLTHLDLTGPWLDVPDPRRTVLDQAVADARSAVLEVTNA